MLSAPLIDPAVMSTIVTHLMIAATVAGVGVGPPIGSVARPLHGVRWQSY